ncbi:MAG: hypothetical protein ACI91C_002055 [Burkholderiaceae bacterium]|jgi:hypothetical protein
MTPDLLFLVFPERTTERLFRCGHRFTGVRDQLQVRAYDEQSRHCQQSWPAKIAQKSATALDSQSGDD